MVIRLEIVLTDSVQIELVFFRFISSFWLWRIGVRVFFFFISHCYCFRAAKAITFVIAQYFDRLMCVFALCDRFRLSRRDKITLSPPYIMNYWNYEICTKMFIVSRPLSLSGCARMCVRHAYMRFDSRRKPNKDTMHSKCLPPQQNNNEVFTCNEFPTAYGSEQIYCFAFRRWLMWYFLKYNE